MLKLLERFGLVPAEVIIALLGFIALIIFQTLHAVIALLTYLDSKYQQK